MQLRRQQMRVGVAAAHILKVVLQGLKGGLVEAEVLELAVGLSVLHPDDTSRQPHEAMRGWAWALRQPARAAG